MVEGYERIYHMVAAERLPTQITLAPVMAPSSPESSESSEFMGSVGSVLPVGSGFPERRDGALSGGLVGP